MGLIDQLMASRAGIAPQIAQMQGARQSPVPAPNQSPVGGTPMQAPQPPAPPNILQRIQGMAQQVQAAPLYQSTLGNEDWRTRKALALNSMRMDPDPNLAAGLREQLVSSREDRKQTQQANRTAEVLEAAGENELADAIRANPGSAGAVYTEYLKARLKPKDQFTTLRGSDLGLTGVDADALYRINTRTNELKSVSSGNSNVVNMPVAETAYEKKTAEGVGTLINNGLDLGPGAQELLATVGQLEALSPYIGQDIKIVPGFLRNMLPEGASETVDAYRSQLNGLVSSLRVAGTGSQSDREMLNMLARGGSIATSPEARAIAHKALRAKAERDFALSDLSGLAATGEISRQQFIDQRRNIIGTPLFTEDDRILIERLEAVPAGGAGANNGGTIQTPQDAMQELLRREKEGDPEAIRALSTMRAQLGGTSR